MWGETAGDIEVIWVNREGKYFCEQGWTGGCRRARLICPAGVRAVRQAAQ